MQEALEHNVLVAGGTGVVKATESICSTRYSSRVG
jgi:hypothetical protein